MAKKNDDILGQIFDFIFAQQGLAPDKRKPIDATGIAGDKELVDAVAAILENPAIFNVEHMAENYSDAVNIKIAELRFSEDNIKKAEIGTSNLADIITDPVGYARKVRDTSKAIRKSMRAKYLGAQATEFVISSYLRKKGFSKELRDIIKNDSRFRDSIKEMYEFSDYKEAEAYAQAIAKPPMLSGADQEYLNARTAKLQAKLSMGRAEWEGLTDSQRNRITKGVLQADKPADVQSTLRSVLGTARGDSIFRRYQSTLNRYGSYREMEIVNLEREMTAIERANRRNGIWQDEAAELAYERTELTKDLIKNSESMRFVAGRKTPQLLANSRQYMRNISNHIDSIKNELKNARRVGDRNAQRVLKEKLKMARTTRRSIAQVNLFGNIGQMEGYINSVRDYWNLQSVIKGDFFKSTKNQFYCPTEKVEFKWNDKKLAEFMVPAHHKDGDSRRALLESYEEFWGRAYYFTPGSIFRTFFYNGEGFAWRAHLQKRKIDKFISNSHVTGFNLDRFISDRTYRDAVLSGATGITNQRFLDMLSHYSRLGDMAQMFSILYRTQEGVLGWANEKIFNKFRGMIYERIVSSRLFSSLSDGAVAMGLLKKWAEKGGLRNLLKGLSQGIAEALGIVAGPGLNLLIGAIVGWVAERLYDLSVPLFGVLVYSVFGLIGVLVISYGLIRGNSINYNISASTPPGAVGYCDANVNHEYFGKNPIDDEIGNGELPPFNPGDLPAGQTCLFTSGPFLKCTQGPYSSCTKPGYLQPSHKNSPAVDVAVGGNFAAPQFCDLAKGNCIVESVGQGTCGGGKYPAGGYVTFKATYEGRTYKFFILHVSYGVTAGQKLDAGQAVATIVHDNSWSMCSTGLHAHLTVQVNGTTYNPRDVLNEDFQCQLSECPVKDVCYIKK